MGNHEKTFGLRGRRHTKHAFSILLPPISGNGHWLKFLRREALRHSPRFVIFQFSGNDVGDNVRERLFTLNTEGGLVENKVPEPSAMRRVQGFVEFIPGLTSSYIFAWARETLLHAHYRQQFARGQKLSRQVNKQVKSSDIGKQLFFAIFEESLADELFEIIGSFQPGTGNEE